MRFLLWIPVMLVMAGCMTDTGDEDEDGQMIDAVTVTDAPDSGEPGEEVEICWDVDGEGEIPHTAVHWASESQSGDDVTFSDYDAGAAYPGGEQSPEQLPASVCATVTLPDEEGTLYFVAHAMETPPGIISDEQEIQVEEEGILP